MGQPSAARGRPLPCGTPPSYRSIGKDAARAGKSFRALFALLFCLAVSPTPLRGQTTGGTLSGTVSDPTGAVVPGADVLAKNLGSANPHNVVKATFKALAMLREPITVSKTRRLALKRVFNG